MLVVGIDPGKSGALCILNATTREIVTIFDMPLLESDGTVDAKLLAVLLSQHNLKLAVLEDVSAMTYMALDANGKRVKRGQGAAASFAFGESKGAVRGVLGALGIRTFLVKPAVWKSLLGLSSNKKESLELARKTFPSHDSQFLLMKHDGRAEAALLAMFGADRLK